MVEAKRDIPWTKPEDIPFDVDKELPKLGGFAGQGFSRLRPMGRCALFRTRSTRVSLNC